MNEKKFLTLPNLLSVLRLAMVPVFVWTYVVRRSDLLTALVLAASGLTDTLDGWIARRFNMVSDVGKLLDPIADKITQGVMLICLVTRFPAMWFPLGLLIVKELIVGATHLMVIRRTGDVDSAKMHGKVATCFLYGMMLTHLLWQDVPLGLSRALIAATTVSMLVSLVMYARQYIGMLKRDREHGSV